MDRDEALKALDSDSWHLRLKGARALATAAEITDLKLLQKALAGETVSFVQTALNSAVRRIRRDIDEMRSVDAEAISPSVMRQVHARAVEDVSRTILHEVESIAGALSLAAAREVPGYPDSATKTQVDRLGKQLEAITRLKAAAAAPKITNIRLGRWVRELVDEELAGSGMPVSFVGPESLTVEGDPALLRLAVCNGLRNAVEALSEIDAVNGAHPPIVVSWDSTDVECWIVIKDDGPGLLGAGTDAIPIGRTTKPGHPGMGLMTANQAMESLSGSMSLTNGIHGGALFEIRWFGL